MKLLVVEDEHKIANSIKKGLEQESYAVDVAYDGTTGFDLASSEDYDVIILDLMLPDMDGLDICKKLRASGNHTSILMLTAKGQVEDKVAGLNSGADDYLVKPFNHGEFLARCRALLRRSPETAPPLLTAGGLVFDPATGVLTCRGVETPLTPRERAIVEILMREVGRAVPKRKLEHALSEFGDDISTNAVELAVSRLRKKLTGIEPGASLETIRGLGYLLSEMKD